MLVSDYRLTAWLVALVVVAGLLGCGPILKSPRASRSQVIDERQRQFELVITEQHEYQSRVYNVGTRLTISAAPLCQNELAPTLGMRLATRDSFEPHLRSAASRTLGVRDNFPVVLSVAPNSPASVAGVQSGWILESVASRRVWSVEAADKAIRSSGNQPISLRMGTLSGTKELQVSSTVACSYPIAVATEDVVNAWADGRSISLNTGMIRFATSDDELALVIGHELAHNLLHHSSKQTANMAAGMLAGLAVDVAAAYGGVDTEGQGTRAGAEVGKRVYSQDFEREADYLGLYLIAAAGFDISHAPDFWLRMGANSPESIDADFLSTHPSSPERAANLRLAVQEIESKLAQGAPLLPKGFEQGTPSLDPTPATVNSARKDSQVTRWERKARSLGWLAGQGSSCGVSAELLDEYRQEALAVLAREAPTQAELAGAIGVYEVSFAEATAQQAPDDPSCHGVVLDVFKRKF